MGEEYTHFIYMILLPTMGGVLLGRAIVLITMHMADVREKAARHKRHEAFVKRLKAIRRRELPRYTYRS